MKSDTEISRDVWRVYACVRTTILSSCDGTSCLKLKEKSVSSTMHRPCHLDYQHMLWIEYILNKIVWLPRHCSISVWWDVEPYSINQSIMCDFTTCELCAKLSCTCALNICLCFWMLLALSCISILRGWRHNFGITWHALVSDVLGDWL